jgi:hypothetical protein
MLAMIVVFSFPVFRGLAQDNDLSMPNSNIEYTWQLSEGEARDLVERIKTLRYRDKLADVRNRLGNASLDTDVFDKKGKFLSHVLHYPIRRVRPEGGNVYDQEIHLRFDDSGELVEIVYTAMPPLTDDVIYKHVDNVTGVKYFRVRPPVRQETE